MLEYKFTELDNDYITLWSNFILNQDYSLIKGKMIALAELGQINAIQTWVMMREKEEINDKIQKYVDEIYSKDISHLSLNELIVVLNNERYNSSDDIKSILYKVVQSYLEAWEARDEWYRYGNPVNPKESEEYEQNFYHARDKYRELYKELLDTKFGKAFEYLKNIDSCDTLTLQRKFEMMDASIRVCWSDENEDDIRIVRKNLLKLCKSKRSGLTEKERPFYEYALAKNIEFFKNIVKTKFVLRTYALNLFKKLADRELSKTLTDYINVKTNNNADELEEQIDTLLARLKEISPDKEIEFSIKDRSENKSLN